MPASTPESTLDAMHAAAAKADAARYWSCFAPGAVFIGTDATERWTLEEFKAYAAPHFASGKGWAYAPSNRHVDYASDGGVAWFDETVSNATYGDCRGSGVLVRTAEGWKVAQYHLTLPIPNELMPEVAGRIKTHLGTK